MTSTIRCINLGSGQRPFTTEGEHFWLNVDINEKWAPDVVADGANMPMFADGTIDVIVAHQVLEHAGCGEAAPTVRECYRILKPGGRLIVCVPNMDALCRGWLAGRINTQLFMTNVYGAYMDNEADRHRWAYDQSSLSKFLLASAPWSHIKPFNESIPGASIAVDWWTLNMEAVK